MTEGFQEPPPVEPPPAEPPPAYPGRIERARETADQAERRAKESFEQAKRRYLAVQLASEAFERDKGAGRRTAGGRPRLTGSSCGRSPWHCS